MPPSESSTRRRQVASYEGPGDASGDGTRNAVAAAVELKSAIGRAFVDDGDGAKPRLDEALALFPGTASSP